MSKKNTCSCSTIAAIYSPDDGGYYAECRSGCWKSGPVRKSEKAALKAYPRKKRS